MVIGTDVVVIVVVVVVGGPFASPKMPVYGPPHVTVRLMIFPILSLQLKYR
jgi:hypothetical protein